MNFSPEDDKEEGFFTGDRKPGPRREDVVPPSSQKHLEDAAMIGTPLVAVEVGNGSLPGMRVRGEPCGVATTGRIPLRLLP